MLSIQRSNPNEPPSTCTPHLLPCRIQHDGPVNASKRYWSPQPSKDGVIEAYFRGRKLQGREVRIPNAYRGIVVKTEAKASENLSINRERIRQRGEGEQGGEDNDEEQEVKVLEEVGKFEEVMVWGHESVADGDHTFVRGLEEWIGFAEAV
ncbi:MAG: hypothetical protein L6R41_008100 [Letrouitia leprolyta]|nr:MAG: hypothetical protein L6R41_008100 [Letrouitia leprolyta]